MDLSVDLMCGIPGQTMATWTATLAARDRRGARHMSASTRSPIEDGTSLAVAVAGGLMEPPDPDLAADMLLAAEFLLAEAGIVRYEVANYARPGHESRHNTAYWTGRPYLGIGPSAHGMLDGATAAYARASSRTPCPASACATRTPRTRPLAAGRAARDRAADGAPRRPART